MNKKSLLVPVIALALLGSLALTIPVLQNRQDIRQRAAERPSPAKDNSSYVVPLPPEDKAYQSPNDTVAPVVSITGPAHSSKVRRNSTVNISAASSDNTNVEKVEFVVNGAVICVSTVAPYVCSWKVPTEANVKYALVARAYDYTGNISSKIVVVTSY